MITRTAALRGVVVAAYLAVAAAPLSPLAQCDDPYREPGAVYGTGGSQTVVGRRHADPEGFWPERWIVVVEQPSGQRSEVQVDESTYRGCRKGATWTGWGCS